jgi:Sulfotransferase family
MPIPPSGGSVTVGFIGATGRSGTTLVGRVLGTAPSVCSVGELYWIWQFGVLQNRSCGCGRPFGECPFWTAVGDKAFGGWDNVDATTLNQVRKDLFRLKAAPRLWRTGPGAHPRLPEYLSTMSALYTAIADVSGRRIVLDNSKQVAAALIALATPGVTVRMIHLVRSPYGVAYSWTKSVARWDLAGTTMRTRSPAKTALHWSIDNVALEAIGRRRAPRLLVRYDDFVTDAARSTARMLGFLEPASGAQSTDALDSADSTELAFVGRDWADLGEEHSVWGNPMRGNAGRESIRSDEGWRTGLSARDRRVVRGLTAPVARRYLG